VAAESAAAPCEPPMKAPSATPLTRKLTQLVSLSAADIAALDGLQGSTRPIARNRELITAGHAYDGVLILIEGVALRSHVLHDGRRQILNIAIPGDVIGFPASFFETALYSVSALTDTVVAPLSFARLLQLFDGRPRVAAAIFWSFSCEAAMYAEHLIDVGRRSAIERTGHFLLELLERLRAVGLADEKSYRMPLTQELIADVLGLSLQHVNRTLRQLREDGLVAIAGRNIVINDTKALAALADFDQRYLSRYRLA
jgi:CRP-like cAMP-binding protein